MTSNTTSTESASGLPDYAPVPRSSLGPAVNDKGYYVRRVERNLYWITDGDYNSAFLTTRDGVVLFDASPTIGHNIQRAVDEIAAANGVSNKVTHLVHTHHHSDHAGAAGLFGNNVVRTGHEETRRLLLRDNDPDKPAPEETFQDRRTLEIGGDRIELTWLGANHTPDNIYIHFPDHDALMLGRGGRIHDQQHLRDPGVDPPGPRLRQLDSPVSCCSKSPGSGEDVSPACERR